MNKEQIINWRTDRGMNQTTLAELAGMSPSYLSSMESGYYGITRKADRKLSRAMALYDAEIEKQSAPVQKTFEDDEWVSQTAEVLSELKKVQEEFEKREAIVEMKDAPVQDTSVDMVNHPNHYANRQYEVIDVMKDTMRPERFIGYLEGTVIKYMMRWDKKFNPAEDLEKAEWYLKKLIETIKEES